MHHVRCCHPLHIAAQRETKRRRAEDTKKYPTLSLSLSHVVSTDKLVLSLSALSEVYSETFESGYLTKKKGKKEKIKKEAELPRFFRRRKRKREPIKSRRECPFRSR